MADVFISYANQNRDTARLLAASLEACGWSVWWDRKIQPGQSFDQAIERELEFARSVIVLWSKDSISSEWVKNEAALAAERCCVAGRKTCNRRYERQRQNLE